MLQLISNSNSAAPCDSQRSTSHPCLSRYSSRPAWARGRLSLWWAMQRGVAGNGGRKADKTRAGNQKGKRAGQGLADAENQGTKDKAGARLFFYTKRHASVAQQTPRRWLPENVYLFRTPLLFPIRQQ
ncbi:hypothetical protein E2C01_085139 [Portunus trituberculatus]|uniref:Uncharacterized protein n=1 Tax=Portunus trituberculatus TaxID=210409 RepID=A0A5B7J816_PORTR|nr:hypothetical protein [Portunus trituberculatus]